MLAHKAKLRIVPTHTPINARKIKSADYFLWDVCVCVRVAVDGDGENRVQLKLGALGACSAQNVTEIIFWASAFRYHFSIYKKQNGKNGALSHRPSGAAAEKRPVWARASACKRRNVELFFMRIRSRHGRPFRNHTMLITFFVCFYFYSTHFIAKSSKRARGHHQNRESPPLVYWTVNTKKVKKNATHATRIRTRITQPENFSFHLSTPTPIFVLPCREAGEKKFCNYFFYSLPSVRFGLAQTIRFTRSRCMSNADSGKWVQSFVVRFVFLFFVFFFFNIFFSCTN